MITTEKILPICMWTANRISLEINSRSCHAWCPPSRQSNYIRLRPLRLYLPGWQFWAALQLLVLGCKQKLGRYIDEISYLVMSKLFTRDSPKKKKKKERKVLRILVTRREGANKKLSIIISKWNLNHYFKMSHNLPKFVFKKMQVLFLLMMSY